MLYLIVSVVLAMVFGVTSTVIFGPEQIPSWANLAVWAIIGAGAIVRLLELAMRAWCCNRLQYRRICKLWVQARNL